MRSVEMEAKPLGEPTRATTWFATIVVAVLLFAGAYELGSSSPLSLTSSSTSAYPSVAAGSSTSTNQTDCNQVGSWPATTISQQEAVNIAQSSSLYQNLTAGAALVNCTGIAFGSGGGKPAFLAVNFAVQFPDLSCNFIVIQVDYSGDVIGGGTFDSIDAPYGQC